jgi:quinoprotein glucose dehydrogenase
LETAEATVRNDPDPRVRSEGRRVLAELVPETASALLAAPLESGETLEKQDALQVLATMKTPAADQVLSDWLTKLVAGDVPLEVQLDLLEAVRSRGTAALTDQLDQFEATRSHDDPLAGFRECLAGGDSERGRQIFFGRAEASCRRCHVVNGEGAAIGPDLTRIGGEKTREYLLEALVAPDRQIAKGFETAVVVTNAGRVYSGIVKEEHDAHLLLLTAGGEEIIVEKSEIDERSTGVSAMPADLVKPLSKPEVRDLVEYLASLKGPTGD